MSKRKRECRKFLNTLDAAVSNMEYLSDRLAPVLTPGPDPFTNAPTSRGYDTEYALLRDILRDLGSNPVRSGVDSDTQVVAAPSTDYTAPPIHRHPVESTAGVGFRNESGLEFTDISSELFRKYKFPGGDEVRIEWPKFLHVSKSGGHRVFDGHGRSHYIPPGWFHLEWEVTHGQPNFVR